MREVPLRQRHGVFHHSASWKESTEVDRTEVPLFLRGMMKEGGERWDERKLRESPVTRAEIARFFLLSLRCPPSYDS